MPTHQPYQQLPSKLATTRPYIGRFAPSPTGPLHLGSLVTAVASYLDARANGGKWLVRIEDVDTTRAIDSMAKNQLETLERFGFEWDGSVVYQSERNVLYRDALQRLQQGGYTFACTCTRSQIQMVLTHQGSLPAPNKEAIYPGTCRYKNHPFELNKTALRFALPSQDALSVFNQWTDRWAGLQQGDLLTDTGDFVLMRNDGIFSYQLAVVVDDAMQNISDVVRGADLLSNTARQLILGSVLGYKNLRYMHVPLVLNAEGQKLSKQSLAEPIGLANPIEHLNRAFNHLGFESVETTVLPEFWELATNAWAQRFASL